MGLIWDEATGLWHSDGEYEKWMDKQVDEARSWASLWKRAAKKWSNWHLTPDIEGRYRCKWHQEWVFTRTERDEARAWAIRRTQERDKLKAELDESELYGKKTHQAWFHEQEQVEELREELRGECAMNEALEAELDALKARRCETCRIWTRDDGGLATDDPAYGYYGDEDKGHCGAQDCDMEHDAFCSDWETRDVDPKAAV